MAAAASTAQVGFAGKWKAKNILDWKLEIGNMIPLCTVCYYENIELWEY